MKIFEVMIDEILREVSTTISDDDIYEGELQMML